MIVDVMNLMLVNFMILSNIIAMATYELYDSILESNFYFHHQNFFFFKLQFSKKFFPCSCTNIYFSLLQYIGIFQTMGCFFFIANFNLARIPSPPKRRKYSPWLLFPECPHQNIKWMSMTIVYSTIGQCTLGYFLCIYLSMFVPKRMWADKPDYHPTSS